MLGVVNNLRGRMIDHQHSESLSDELLLQNIRSGCADCFATLFHRYFGQVFATAFKIVRNRGEAEDVLQEVFLAIFLQQERFDPCRGSVKTWILQFAYFKSLLRRRYLRIRNFYHYEEQSEERELRSLSASNLSSMSPGEWGQCVRNGLATLSSKQRKVIELMLFEGYTLQESCELMGETLANTRNNYYRGLKALRTFLNAELGHRCSPAVVLAHSRYDFQS